MTFGAVEMHIVLTLLGAVALGAVLCVLGLLVVRGRFGTARRRVVFDLTEVASHDVPKGAALRRSARCMGHSADRAPVRGTGVLWLTDDTLGFSVREPRTVFTIDLVDVVSVSARQVVRRPGVRAIRSKDRPFVVVEWGTGDGGTAMVSWRLDPEVGEASEQEWVEAIDRARVVQEIRAGAQPVDWPTV